MQYNVTGSDGASVVIDAPNWMVAIGKAMALLDIDPEAMGRWVCVPRADGEVDIDDPVTGRSWKIEPVQGPKVVAVGPSAPEEPEEEAPAEEPEPVPSGPPPALDMPVRSTLQAPEPEPEPEPEGGPPEDLAERLFDLSFDITGAEPDQACRLSLDLVLEFVPCEAASVLRGTLNDVALTFVAASGPVADELIGRTVEFGTGLVGLSFDLGFPIEVQDVAHDERHLKDIDRETGFSTRHALCVPVKNESGTYGVIQLINPPDGFADWHVDTVATISRTLAGALAAS